MNQPSAQMVSAAFAGAGDLTVIYTRAITAAQFTPEDFQSDPSTETGVIVAQEATNELRITMSGDPSSDLTLTYTGTDPPALTPQTVDID